MRDVARAPQLDGAEAAAAVTLGGTVTYEGETVEGSYELRQLFHAPEWLLDAWVSTYTAIASGAMSRVSNDIEHITGHPTTTLIDVVRAQQ